MLVNRRFRALCLHPQLLRRITLAERARGGGGQQQVAVAALLLWLEGHGEHVRHLEVEGGFASAADQLALCLSRAPQTLQTLSINWHLPSAGMAWLPRLTALRTLRLRTSYGRAHLGQALRLPADFSRLTQLAEADLAGYQLMFDGSRLPSSLTRLCLATYNPAANEQMPQQLSTLTNLAQLQLRYHGYTPASMAPLTACTALRDLRFCDNQALPACLPRLTQLQRLVACVPWSHGEETVTVRAALHAFTRLTFMALSGAVEGLLPDIVAAQHIQSLGLLMSQEAVGAPPLPAGPWLARLRCLGLPWPMLSTCLETLGHAPRLERLCSIGLPQGGGLKFHAFWELAATHPPLRCLELQGGPCEAASPALQDALGLLAMLRPGLHVRRTALHSTDDSWDDMASGSGHA